MERLRSLIKEVLTVQPKKDCNCGCGGCSKKAPIITEGRIKKAISEGLTYHVENKIPLHESVYRIGSEKHFALINEARKLWVRGLIDVSEDDQAILETHLGNFGLYETVNFEGEEYDIISKDGDWVYLRSIHDTQVGRKEIKVKEKDITINEAKVPLDMPMVHEELEKDYIEHLQNIRNDFYNKGDKEKAAEVQADIDKLLGESLNEGTFQGNEIAIYGGEDGETYIEKRGTGYYGYNNSFDFTAEDKAELKQMLSGWGYYPIAGSIDENLNEEGYDWLKNPSEKDKKYLRKKYESWNAMNPNDQIDIEKALKGIYEDIYDKFLDDPQSPKGRAKAIISKFIKQYGKDASGMAVDRFAKQNNLKPEEKYILQYITKNDISISSKPGGPDFSALSEATSKYPDFDLDKNIKYQDTSISSGMWRYTGKEQGGKGVYRNLMNDQFLGFSSDDFDFFKKHLGSHFDISESLDEAKKKKDPPLNKPKRGGSKAYYVYVRDPKTKKIKKVSFGSGGLRAKIKNKEARNAFAARHNCDKKKDRTTAGYWSCNLPRYADQLGLGSKMNTFW
jgi:hypothetical protein